ncbi:hypothetical protein GRF29_112g1608879 [Pseudopithomyces chartarum]|uniref:Uncharacterized protein n=1 Tax=Pseudopithomyces chartarum TaxID=1892770 RepID=A0AAN6LWH6_9PLEO|nr:hypothetical protein GRF29_112g1608879 [Pseudopithomyces chartarum]
MHLLSLTALASLLPLTTSLPTSPLSTFYLVTSDQSTPTQNSSQLRGVHATTPYSEDPVSQSTLLLRLIGPGYNSLPNFTLTSGVLSTTTSGPHGIGYVQYNSSTVTAGQELQFLARAQEGGM